MDSQFRIVVAGCRNFTDYEKVKKRLEIELEVLGSRLVIVSGGAAGADSLGERFAKEHNLEIERFPADWKKYGKAAGPIRNEQMAQVADMVIAFWDGKSKGTENMLRMANKYGVKMDVQLVRIDKETK